MFGMQKFRAVLGETEFFSSEAGLSGKRVDV
jgi:hypothetical protein